MKKLLSLIIITFFLASCSSPDGLPRNYKSFDANNIPNPVPKVEPKSRYGNPATYTVRGKTYHVLKTADCYEKKGFASWYGTKFHERLTSSREPYSMYKMTAANKVLPLPTYVRVRNLENNKTIVVKVNDRGPFHANRIIDLSFAAAKKIGMMGKGTALVDVQAIDPRHPNKQCGEPKQTSRKHSKTYIYLQLGAFSQKNNADKLANRIADISRQTISVKATRSGDKHYYKVLIGPLKGGVEEVDSLSAKLKQKGFGEAYAIVI
jgi:rare lipoprotein A